MQNLHFTDLVLLNLVILVNLMVLVSGVFSQTGESCDSGDYG